MVKPTIVPHTISPLLENSPLVTHKIMHTMAITYENTKQKKYFLTIINTQTITQSYKFLVIRNLV